MSELSIATVGKTYHSKVYQRLFQFANNIVHVNAAVHETQPLRECELSNNIESVELEPFAKVADSFGLISVPLRKLLQELGRGGIDKGLKLYEAAHSVGTTYGSSKLGMVLFVRGAEHTLHQMAVSFDGLLLDGIKFRL